MGALPDPLSLRGKGCEVLGASSTLSLRRWALRLVCFPWQQSERLLQHRPCVSRTQLLVSAGMGWGSIVLNGVVSERETMAR